MLFKPDLIIITCARSPIEEFCYRKRFGVDTELDEHLDQLVRRLERVVEFKADPQLGCREMVDKTAECRRAVGLPENLKLARPGEFEPLDVAAFIRRLEQARDGHAELRGDGMGGDNVQ